VDDVDAVLLAVDAGDQRAAAAHGADGAAGLGVAADHHLGGAARAPEDLHQRLVVQGREECDVALELLAAGGVFVLDADLRPVRAVVDEPEGVGIGAAVIAVVGADRAADRLVRGPVEDLEPRLVVEVDLAAEGLLAPSRAELGVGRGGPAEKGGGQHDETSAHGRAPSAVWVLLPT
jgi:hypothetical protein